MSILFFLVVYGSSCQACSEKFENIKGVIRRRKAKMKRQYNNQKKTTNNESQNTRQKTKG